MMYAQFTDLIKAVDLLNTARSSGLDFWEGLTLILFVVKDLLIVGGILGTIIWYIKRRDGK